MSHCLGVPDPAHIHDIAAHPSLEAESARSIIKQPDLGGWLQMPRIRPEHRRPLDRADSPAPRSLGPTKTAVSNTCHMLRLAAGSGYKQQRWPSTSSCPWLLLPDNLGWQLRSRVGGSFARHAVAERMIAVDQKQSPGQCAPARAPGHESARNEDRRWPQSRLLESDDPLHLPSRQGKHEWIGRAQR